MRHSCFGALGLLLGCTIVAAKEDDVPTYALGAGVQRMPTWQGSKDHRNQSLPYFDIEIPGLGELSVADGLMIELIHGETWHGGLYGNRSWGRTRDDLGPLGGRVASLSPRLQSGGYLEYVLSPKVSIGAHVAHDIAGAGAYATLYADYRLPDLWYAQHSIELTVCGVNRPAIIRLFGITPIEANNLHTPPWEPHAGGESTDIEYDVFIPTSQRTGFALSLSYGRLFGQAASSPLVRSFGSTRQASETLAFVFHF